MTGAAADPWGALAGSGGIPRGELRVLPAGVATLEGQILRAIDGDGGRHLLLPCRAGALPEPDERSGGVHLRERVLLDGGAKSHFVDVECRKPHLAEVFDRFVDEILAAVPTEAGRPATVARRVLNRWRDLFDRERPGVLAEEALVGLFGELWHLEQFTAADPAALAAWTGPSGARTDFRHGAVCLEVKTTTASDRRVVQIHGVEQLEPPPGAELLLSVVTLERTPGAGDSVPTLVARIRAHGVDAHAFTARLRGAGYDGNDAPYYADRHFTVRAHAVYRVDADFPRIVPASFVEGALPARVSGLRYTLDLTVSPPHALTDGDAEKALQGLWAR